MFFLLGNASAFNLRLARVQETCRYVLQKIMLLTACQRRFVGSWECEPIVMVTCHARSSGSEAAVALALVWRSVAFSSISSEVDCSWDRTKFSHICVEQSAWCVASVLHVHTNARRMRKIKKAYWLR